MGGTAGGALYPPGTEGPKNSMIYNKKNLNLIFNESKFIISERNRENMNLIQRLTKRKIVSTAIFFTYIFQAILTAGQFTPSEISKRSEWEEYLKNAEILKYEDIGEGITKPFRLYLKMGEIEESGCWKNPQGKQQGYLEGWQYEIAAYEMDKLIGLNMVPPTVERKFKNKRGSLQYWVTSVMSDLDRMESGIQIPSSKLDHWNKRKYLTRAFDCLIGNEDRTQQNIRYTEDWRTILIDHSRSFRSSKKLTKQLMYGKNGIKGQKLFRELPRSFIENIKALSFEKIKEAVGPYLKDKEIQAVLARKKLLLDEVEEMIKEKGEGKVLY